MINFALNCLFLASERSGMQRKIWLANHKKEISKTYTSSVYEQHRSKSAKKDIFCSASERKRISQKNFKCDRGHIFIHDFGNCIEKGLKSSGSFIELESTI